AYTNLYTNVIAVGASNNSDTRASYSSYGTGLDLVAPVGTGASTGNAAYGQTFNDADAWTSTPLINRDFTTYGNKFWIGTSFSSPQVTSIAAMLFAKSTYLKPSDVKIVLRNTAQDVGAGGYDTQTGFGIPNFQAAWASVSQNAWDIWITNGGTPGEVVEATFKNRVYQTVRGFNNWYYTRYSLDGKNWTNWDPLGGTPGDGAMIAMKDGLGADVKLFQSIRGFNNWLYTRYTTDGDNWSTWVPNGGTPGEPTMATFKGKIYQAIRGVDNHIYTRSSSDGDTWSAWLENGGSMGKVAMASLADTKLYQSIRGIDNHIYTRVSTDGTTWSAWDENGGSFKDVTFGVYGTKLYSGITGTNSIIYTRYIDVGSSIWTTWTQDTFTLSDISFSELNGVLFRALRGGDGRMYVSSSADGIGFGPWEQDISIANNIAMVTFTLPDTSKVIVQAAVSPTGIVNTRRSQ
ncbi:MAG: S8 family serine peptidase, partial [Candidatus Dojkabacteria bacterium]